jgi:hypothetical protein
MRRDTATRKGAQRPHASPVADAQAAPRLPHRIRSSPYLNDVIESSSNRGIFYAPVAARKMLYKQPAVTYYSRTPNHLTGIIYGNDY